MVLECIDGSAALIVVDVQVGTLPNAKSVPADGLVANIADLITVFRQTGRAIAFVVSAGTNPGRTQYGSEGRKWPEADMELDARIGAGVADPVFPRLGWSAFAATGLSEYLGAHEVKQVVIVGLATTFGVESTARQAADLGYDVVVVSDAVSDPDPAGHERSLTRVIPALGVVAATAEVIAATA